MITGLGSWTDHTGDASIIYVPQCLGPLVVTQMPGSCNSWKLSGNLPLPVHRTSWLAQDPPSAVASVWLDFLHGSLGL